MLAIERLIDDDRGLGCAQLVQHRVANPLHDMDEKSFDTPASESGPMPESTPASEVQPGTGKRDRATQQGDGLDPTRYGDWEMNGRCIDF